MSSRVVGSDWVSDPLGLWVLDNVPGAYGGAGFVYFVGRGGVVVACGGDAAITVGVYADADDAFGSGDALHFLEWPRVEDLSAAISAIREWLPEPEPVVVPRWLFDQFSELEVRAQVLVSVTIGGVTSDWVGFAESVHLGDGDELFTLVSFSDEGDPIDVPLSAVTSWEWA